MSCVLLVEDAARPAQGMRLNLEMEGHAVDVLADGTDALVRVLRARGAYDLVILDAMLPGHDGFEVAARLRQANEYVPILMLITRGRPEDVLRGFEVGANDYLPKPFEQALLLARVHGLLRRRDWMRPTADNRAPRMTPRPPDIS